MKKTIALILPLASIIFLAGCGQQQTIELQPKTSETASITQPKEQPTTTQATISKITEETQSDLKEYAVSEAGIIINFPKDYEISKNITEENRRGSFASYYFSGVKTLPQFQEIQFFSKESIDKFTKHCANGPCFFGDFPNLERYDGQKNAFEENKDYLEYKLKKFNDRYYFTSNFKCSGDSCVIREYTTFIGSNKIDVWVTMESESQEIEADKLFGSFEIIE